MNSFLQSKPLLMLLNTLALSITITACGGNSSSASNAPPIKQQLTSLGEVYTDDAGMTLYTFNQDEPNISNCNGGCATKWPPLIAKIQLKKKAGSL